MIFIDRRANVTDVEVWQDISDPARSSFAVVTFAHHEDGRFSSVRAEYNDGHGMSRRVAWEDASVLVALWALFAFVGEK